MTEPAWQDQSSGTMMGNIIVMSIQLDEDNMMPTLAIQCQSCQQQQVYHLNQTCYSFNSRLYQMEQHMAEIMDNQRQAQKQPSQFERPDPSSGHNRCRSEEDLYNGFTNAHLIHDLPGKGWKGDSKWLLRRMFTFDELRGHTITGGHGKTKKTGSVRPPLEDQTKWNVSYDIMDKLIKPSAPGMAD